MSKISEIFEGKLASVQAEFEPIFWLHNDPETILRFAEESICGRLSFEYEKSNILESLNYASKETIDKVLELLKKDYDYSINQKINNTTLIYSIHSNHEEITREQALELVGKKSFKIQDRTNNVHGRVADVFTIKETKEQTTGPEFTNVEPFTARKVTVSFELREIK